LPLETQDKLRETKKRNRLDGNCLPAIEKTHRIREVLNLIKKQTNVLPLNLTTKTHFNRDSKLLHAYIKQAAQFKTETQ